MKVPYSLFACDDFKPQLWLGVLLFHMSDMTIFIMIILFIRYQKLARNFPKLSVKEIRPSSYPWSKRRACNMSAWKIYVASEEKNLHCFLPQLDFLTEEEEETLVTGCDSIPWDLSQSGRRKQVNSQFILKRVDNLPEEWAAKLFSIYYWVGLLVFVPQSWLLDLLIDESCSFPYNTI